jgi:hypothetical protein
MGASLVGAGSEAGLLAFDGKGLVDPIAQGMILVPGQEGIDPDHGEQGLAIEPAQETPIARYGDFVFAGPKDDRTQPLADRQTVGRSSNPNPRSKFGSNIDLQRYWS